MKTISILVPESSVFQSIADPQYCFSTVNQFLVMEGKAPVFNIELVGLKDKIALNEARFIVQPDKILKDAVKTDLIIIPALFGNIPEAVQLNNKYVPWIVEQYNNGAEVASLCVGAFLLAETGLLEGRKCSTHWGFTNLFREMYPCVAVQDGSIVTDENGIYTSGGAHSYWNLLLHLVEKYTDRAMAILISKYFAVDINRSSQSPFSMFKGQKEHTDEAVRKAQEYIEQRIMEKMSVDALASIVAVGRRSFERRFRKATNNSVLEYIHRVKMEAAKRSFESSHKNISEVMFDVGYSDIKAFRTIFKKVTGLTPIDYRNRYNKKALFLAE